VGAKEEAMTFFRGPVAGAAGKPGRPSRWNKLALDYRLVWLSRLFDWRDALVIVKPETVIGRHRQGFSLLWC
jgi:hypothetical protein